MEEPYAIMRNLPEVECNRKSLLHILKGLEDAYNAAQEEAAMRLPIPWGIFF